MIDSHRGFRRVLAVAHVGMALMALGVGNAAIGGEGGLPAALHLVLGVTLLATALGLWRGDEWVRWLAFAGGVVGVLVLGGFFQAAQSRGEAPLVPLLGAAIVFVTLEAAAFGVLGGFGSRAG